MIQSMKMKMMQFEKWEISSLLPQEWMFKVKCDGWTKEKKFYENIHYLSSEGVPFESMRQAIDFMTSSKRYTEENVANCKEFLRLRSHSDKSFDWEEGDGTIPSGWKMRNTDSASDYHKQYFLSPEGIQYRSRYIAFVDMVKRKYPRKEREQMKQFLIEHENWQISDLLPQGWLFKVKCEGFTRDKKYYETIHYLSSEGVTYESLKAVIDHLDFSEYYTEHDIEKAKEFVAIRNHCDKSYDWKEGDDSLPPNWKMRVSEGDAEMEWILSPEGSQYRYLIFLKNCTTL